MKINWLWDTRLSETRVKKILKNERDLRFYIYAEKLFSRVSDPKIVFGCIPKEVFCRNWPAISKRIQKDAWVQERADFWQNVYEKTIGAHPERMNIAEQIKNIRTKLGYSQNELAKKLGVI